MSLSAGDHIGPYEVRDHIGSGGMGEVYRGHDPKLRRDVALKVLPAAMAHDADRMARFEREARLLASLNHPNIAAIYGFEDTGSTRALVMELVEGPTLADRLMQGALPQDEALDVARQVADALEYAHDRGVIHRDLKPANVKVTGEGAVKVLDFGLAKAMEDEPAPSNPGESPTLTMNATRAGVILGTAAYMAPEQAKGKTATRRADVWAFGVLLFEMLTGRRPFIGETATETMASVMKEPLDLTPLPAETPPAIRTLIHRCLEKDPKQRLQAIGEARITLTGPLTGSVEAVSAPPEKRRSPLWPAAAALLAIASGALAFVHFRETPPVRQTLRYQIHPPDDKGGLFPTLSPDGRLLVFLAPSPSGQPQLWIQSLDALEAKPIAGTEGAVYPFWSPDSANIAFFADGQLKKVAVAGGPAVKLADVVDSRGGTWWGDVILYAGGPRNPIYRISSGGGTPQALKATNSDNAYRFPWFLPDGVHYLVNLPAEQSGVGIASLEGGEVVRLLDDGSNAIYVPPTESAGTGYVLFRREQRTLMAQPFDASALRFSGEAFPVADPVATGVNTGFGDFSASANGILVYRPAGPGQGDRRLVWMDRTGKQLEAVTEPGEFGAPSLSPGGTKVAFLRGPNGTQDVWVQDLAGGAPSRVTFFGGRTAVPLWSPDGTSLAVTRFSTGATGDLLRIPVSGGKEELLHAAGVNGRLQDWSRDGRWLVYRESGETTAYDLFLLPLEGDRKPVPYLQTPANEIMGRFSPDRRWMAYVSDESGTPQVYVQDIPATGRKYQISTDGFQLLGSGAALLWRRDGAELYFVGPAGLMAVPVTTGETFQHGTPKRLFTPQGPVSAAPDGQRFLVSVPAEDRSSNTNPPFTIVTNWQATLAK